MSQPTAQGFNFDAHFPTFNAADDSFIFFGASSVHVLSTELLAAACPNSALLSLPDRLPEGGSGFSVGGQCLLNDVSSNITPSESLVLHLLNVYQRSCMIFWPFQLDSVDNTNIEIFIQSTRSERLHSAALTRSEVHSHFQLSMICSIAAVHASRTNAAMASYEQFFYDCALKLMNDILSETTSDSHKDLMLIIIYLLFRPQKGDLWLLLESACRLAIELGYHRDHAAFPESFDQKFWRSHNFWTLYRLGEAVSEVYGRPSDDLESITTVELPSTPLPATTIGQLPSTASIISSSLASLSRLRSDVFKNVYLSATPSSSGTDATFLRMKVAEIEQWHHDAIAQAADPLSDISFRIAHHSSIIFLFQKSVLHALSDIRGVWNHRSQNLDDLASHSFESACEIINCYESIILLEDGSRHPNFPVTCISAHEIYAASLSIMAYSFRRLTGIGQQDEFHAFLARASGGEDFSRGDQPPERREWRNVHSISATCLSLLTWCAMRWSGMDGMLEVFRELSTTILPALTRKGLS